jgi:sulfopropanediol 3-dehydrogenase
VATVIKAAQAASTGPDAAVAAKVSEMLRRIERDGMDAVRRYARELDGCDLDDPVVADGPAYDGVVSSRLRDSIAFAQRQVRGCAEAQRSALSALRIEPLPGVVLGHRLVPVGRVGSYVPGGSYPLIASAFMTVLVPKVAGVEHVAATAPPFRDGTIHPTALYAIRTSGADVVYRVGGVQGVAMMAFGLADEPVDMIVGPGNAFVTEAKRQLFGRVGIDLLAGPSEVLLIADETADPATVALDLAAQAEHGPTSLASLITTSRALAESVLDAIGPTLASLRTREIAERAWRDHGSVTVAADHDEALELADRMAAEHVQVHVSEAELGRYRDELRNFGSMFLGHASTVVFGDKAVGTNHCLPTGRAARFTGGLWVGTFLRALTYQEVDATGALAVAGAARDIAEAELLDGHAQSAARRLALHQHV